MFGPNASPTATDIAYENSQLAIRGQEAEAKAREQLQGEVYILKGQVGFLARLVEDLITGYKYHLSIDRKLLSKIARQENE